METAHNVERVPDEDRTYSLPFIPKFEFIETEARAKEVAKELLQFRVLAVDTETTNLDPYTSNILLLQIATPDKCYILNCTKVSPGVWNEVLEHPNTLKIIQNAKFDYKMIRVHTGGSIRPVFCTHIAERLITAGRQKRTSLKYMCFKYLGIELDKDIRQSFIGTVRTRFSLAEQQYAAVDALILHEIYDRHIDILQRDGLLAAAMLEFRTVIPIAEMEVSGCLIDEIKWRTLLEVAKKNKDEIEEKIQNELKPVCDQLSLFGNSTINIASQKQLLMHLKKLGIELADTSEESLKSVKHKVTDMLLVWRGWEKILTSYGDKFLGKINKKTGRLHADFNQVQADTGRMSSSNPNLQQIPGYIEDDPTSLNFRSCFIAPPGYKMVTSDFSQQELRIIAELSKDENMISAFVNGEDIHTRTAINIWGGTPEEVKANGRRKIAKTVNFLMCYGGSAFTLSARLGITEDEAEDIINGYFRVYPGVKEYIHRSGNFAVENGYSLTVSGRRRYYDIPTLQSPDYKSAINAVKRKGANTPVQGSAADVSKQALCNFFYELEKSGLDARVLMIVHDEIVCEAKEEHAEEVSKLLEKCMIKGFSDFFKTVPMTADACVDSYWHH